MWYLNEEHFQAVHEDRFEERAVCIIFLHILRMLSAAGFGNHARYISGFQPHEGNLIPEQPHLVKKLFLK